MRGPEEKDDCKPEKVWICSGPLQRVRLEEARLKEQCGKTYTDRQIECSESMVRKWQSKVTPYSS